MKAICIPAFNRPQMLRETMAAIRKNNLSGWEIFISMDDAACGAEKWQSVRSWENAFRLGCSLNSFVVCSKAIADGAEAILFMDDDILLSEDALDLCDWYLARHHTANDAGIALCRKDDNDHYLPQMISTKDTWMGHLGQGWCFTRKIWFDFVLRHWWTHEHGMGNHDTYDWALCYMAQKLGKVIMRPRSSRAKHNAAVGYHGPGLGIFPDRIAEGRGHSYQLE